MGERDGCQDADLGAALIEVQRASWGSGWMATHRVLVRLSTLQERTEARHGSSVMQGKYNNIMVSPGPTRPVFLIQYFVSGLPVADLYQMSTEAGQPQDGHRS